MPAKPNTPRSANTVAARQEEAALAAATQRLSEENDAAAASLARVRDRNAALQSLLREQQDYLDEVEGQIARLQARRQAWRERYAELTGRSPEEPAAVPPRG